MAMSKEEAAGGRDNLSAEEQRKKKKACLQDWHIVHPAPQEMETTAAALRVSWAGSGAISLINKLPKGRAGILLFIQL